MKKLMEYIISISGLTGLILQFVDEINNRYKIIISAVFFIAFIITLILVFFENRSISKKARIKKANNFILNSKNEIILYGGNLSWTDDYKDCIRKKIESNCIVRVYYDKRPLKDSALSDLKKRIETLQYINCEVYQLNENLNLRCIISDPKDDFDSYKVLIISKPKEGSMADDNRYIVTYADHKKNRELGILIKKIYKMTMSDVNAEDIKIGEKNEEKELSVVG